ncbi:hypothetical protein [Streptomyces sp. t39]|uniref:hypothetical protein n=1 Tax=Streptomyces sp. t39 TaxID=1828156 RepID=UPI0011CD8B69|nr:hypothetical protein [Streptomyces sp. t39]
MRLEVLDHFTRMLTDARARADDDALHAHQPAPAPADPYAVFDWWAGLDIDDQARADARDTALYHQELQQAILTGDHSIVCRHPCPDCGCWGLQWDTARRRAVCTYAPCTDDQGLANTWTLKNLAHHHIQRQKRLNRRAT